MDLTEIEAGKNPLAFGSYRPYALHHALGNWHGLTSQHERWLAHTHNPRL